MEKNDFIKYCKILLRSVSVNIEEQTSNCSNILILKSLNLPDFITFIEEQKEIMFFFHYDKETVYLIKDRETFNPPIYYNDGDLFLEESSNFLLIELALWISTKSKNTYSIRKFNYLKIRDYFPIWIRGTYCLYTLRINTSLSSFFIRQGDKKITFVAPSPEVLDNILQSVDCKKESSEQKSTSNKIFEVDLSGTKVNAELAYSPNSQTEIDKWLSILKPEELDKMKIRLSKKLTKDVFSQTDNVSKQDLMEQTNLLYGNMSIDKIIVDKGYITIIFLAPNVLPDYVINCQLNKRLSIIDYYLE